MSVKAISIYVMVLESKVVFSFALAPKMRLLLSTPLPSLRTLLKSCPQRVERSVTLQSLESSVKPLRLLLSTPLRLLRTSQFDKLYTYQLM